MRDAQIFDDGGYGRQGAPDDARRDGQQHSERQHHGVQEGLHDLPGPAVPDQPGRLGAGRQPRRHQPLSGGPGGARLLHRDHPHSGSGPVHGQQVGHDDQRGRVLRPAVRKQHPLQPCRSLHARCGQQPGAVGHGLPRAGLQDGARSAEPQELRAIQHACRHQHPHGQEDGAPRHDHGGLPVQPGQPQLRLPALRFSGPALQRQVRMAG